MKNILCTLAASLALGVCVAQEPTNAFLDLQREGKFSSNVSTMQKSANDAALAKLLSEKPKANYFIFTEERNYDVVMRDSIPQRWCDRAVEQRTTLSTVAAPGEYLTYQVALFTPFQTLDNVEVQFSTLKNDNGNKIDLSSIESFNTGGINTSGERFKKQLNVNKGAVQALWLGVDVPKDANGTYHGVVTIKPQNAASQKVNVSITVQGDVLEGHGDNDGWRKGRLRWLNSTIGIDQMPTAPYTALEMQQETINYLGGQVTLGDNGLPVSIVTNYQENNTLDRSVENQLLSSQMKFVVETNKGEVSFRNSKIKITKQTPATIEWTTLLRSTEFELLVNGTFNFDGQSSYNCQLKSLKAVEVRDIRLEVPYTQWAAKYMMGLGHKGGYRSSDDVKWQWNIDKHQDKVWMGNVNGGLNFIFMDENYKRPLVNVYYELGKLKLPQSWGNQNRGGIIIEEQANEVLMSAYSGSRSMERGDVLNYNFNMLITPVKPLNMQVHATERFYHSNSDLSSEYISEASKAGATAINIHHKKEIYPFINYPYYDESLADLKAFSQQAQDKGLDMRLYYTTRELTVKIPELWALHSLNGEVIYDGPGKDARTLIHSKGPHKWLVDNMRSNFIPAWYNAFNEGKYKGDMDLSVITTPDSRWNNYYLQGLDWMIHNIDLMGVYIDDSALDRTTLQRARRILDSDGKQRLIDIHSWNHNNEWAGFANSLHIYLELLPYVDKCWIGEGFSANNTNDFWLVEMSGIPFGHLSESLDAHNSPRGMAFAMLPRIPWSGNPVPMWKLWDEFGMQDAQMYGYWDSRNPVVCSSQQVHATLYHNSKTGKTLVALTNWSDKQQSAAFSIKNMNDDKIKITPARIDGMQDGSQIVNIDPAGGAMFIVEGLFER